MIRSLFITFLVVFGVPKMGFGAPVSAVQKSNQIYSNLYYGHDQADLLARMQSAYQRGFIYDGAVSNDWLMALRAFEQSGFSPGVSSTTMVTSHGSDDQFSRFVSQRTHGLKNLPARMQNVFDHFSDPKIDPRHKRTGLIVMSALCRNDQVALNVKLAKAAHQWLVKASTPPEERKIGFENLTSMYSFGCIPETAYRSVADQLALEITKSLPDFKDAQRVRAMFNLARGGYFRLVDADAVSALVHSQRDDGSWVDAGTQTDNGTAFQGAYVLASVLKQGGYIFGKKDLVNMLRDERMLVRSSITSYQPQFRTSADR